MMGRHFTGVFLAIMTLAGAVESRAEPPPLEAYAALPVGQEPRLSPDGDALAMISPVNGRPVLLVHRLDGGKPASVNTGDTTPNWFVWKTSKRLLASVRSIYRSQHNDEVYERTRLVFLDADGGDAVVAKLDKEQAIGSSVSIGNRGNLVPQFQDRVISLLPDDPDHILIEVTPKEDFLHPDVMKIDIHDGAGRDVLRHQGLVVNWLADANGAVRVGEKVSAQEFMGKHNYETYIARDTADGDWQTINEGMAGQGQRFAPVGFVKDAPNLIYVLADGDNGRLAGRQFDLRTHGFVATVAGDPECDARPLEHNFQLVGFQVPCRQDGIHYFDPAWQHDMAASRNALKATSIKIIDRTGDGKRTLLSAVTRQNEPLTYYILDRRGEKPTLSPVLSQYDKVPPEALGEIRDIVYRARDGLSIPAFLTLPANYHGAPIPFVVLPHGGPTAQDGGGFDWIAQFLSSRGYGVLQPQFRGSTGHGIAFQRAGEQQWGLAMQDDLTDGTRWLIDQKFADPARICIVGGSYGGYAALMGAVKEPGLYACAAAFAPVTDVNMLVHRFRVSTFGDLNVPHIKADGQSVDATSPAENAEKIRIPVLLMHGRKDFTVPVEHSETMEQALRRAGKRVEAIYLDDADHYFSSTADRVAWLGALEKFLSENLGSQPSGN